MFTKITYLKNSTSYVEASGKLDIYHAPDYIEEIKEHIRGLGIRELILEFSKIEYVASIGLRTILELYKLMQYRGGHIKLKNVNKEVMNVFEMTGFDKFLTIENDSDNDGDENSAEKDK